MKLILFSLIVFMGTFSFGQTSAELLKNIQSQFASQKGIFAMAYRNIATGETLLINEHENFHAASTMKTPVMIEIFKQVAAGKLSFTDSVIIKNEFKSIVDGSSYRLSAEDDSEQDLYKKVGSKTTIYDLVYRMIIMSSNLATNMLIEMADGKKVTRTMRKLGAKDIQVRRGVEDNKAFALGLNNTTTAFDLMVIFTKMAEGKIINKKAGNDMINILLDQKHNDLIPSKLPAEVKVAHKTGFIKGVHHDSGIVFLPDGQKYVLVILSKNLEDEKAGVESIGAVSEMIYHYVISRK